MIRLFSYGAVPGLISLLLLGYVLPVAAQTQQFDRGAIDWNKLVVRAIGIGAGNPEAPESARRAMALRAARLDAYRNVLEIVKGVTLTGETTIKNFMTENDVIRSKVEGLVQGAQFGEPRYKGDGSLELECTVPMTGVMADALLYTQATQGAAPPTSGWTWVGQPTAPTPAGARKYTGLIIDARGLGVHPALAPKVLAKNGQELYSSATIPREYALKMGVAGYAKDLDTAKQDSRVTAAPLIIKAIDAVGANRTDVVILDADAATVQQANEVGGFLKECRLMILVD
jgi:hypothetical protein